MQCGGLGEILVLHVDGLKAAAFYRYSEVLVDPLSSSSRPRVRIGACTYVHGGSGSVTKVRQGVLRLSIPYPSLMHTAEVMEWWRVRSVRIHDDSRHDGFECLYPFLLPLATQKLQRLERCLQRARSKCSRKFFV